MWEVFRSRSVQMGFTEKFFSVMLAQVKLSMYSCSPHFSEYFCIKTSLIVSRNREKWIFKGSRYYTGGRYYTPYM